MSANKDILDGHFEKAAIAQEAFVAGINRCLEDGFINKATYDLFTTLDEGFGFQLKALKLLASSQEARG